MRIHGFLGLVAAGVAMWVAMWVAMGVAAAQAARAEAAGLPLLFEEHGPGVFRVRGNGYAVSVDNAGMTLATAAGAARLAWTGARAVALPAGQQPLATRVNYLSGRGPGASRTGIPTFGRLRAAGLYPGIDLVFYGSARQVEYDFVVRPGADPGHISFSLPARLDADGTLALANGLRWRKPVARQGGEEVAVQFVARGEGRFGFALGAYDPSRELIIDPVLTYSTYLGGSLADDARSVAADAAGNTYVTGSTLSVDFPGTTGGQTNGGQDVYVAKLNASGRALEWATYIGGTGADTGMAVAVDASGVYVTGQTASTNFPVTANAPQSRLSGGSGVTDVFVLKLAPSGRSLLYSTYLGGSQSEVANAIAVDGSGAAYVAGRTDSTDFPSTTKATLPVRGGGDGFVTKLAADGGSFVYSSLLGGFALDVVNAIALDPTGAAYVTGETRSDNFPVTENAYQKERRGSSDAFVTKLSPDGASLVFSTYFGGDGPESGRGIGVDRFGNPYIAGGTGSANLPVSFNAAQRAPALLPDAFVAKLEAKGASLFYGTYLGGDAEDTANAIAVDANGVAYVAGTSNSSNFPVFNDGPLPAVRPRGGFDGFVTRMSPGGNFIQFSTLYGGAGTDTIQSLVTDGRGRLWIAGTTDSSDLPSTAGALAAKAPGAVDGFVALLSEIAVTVTPGAVTLGPSETQQFTATVSNTGNTAVQWSIFPDLGTISTTGLYTAPGSFVGSPSITVSAISAADGTKIGQAIVTLENRISVTLTPASVSLQAGRAQQFMATVNGAANQAVTWSIAPQIGTISAAGLYTAPASFLAEATVTVRATSVADTSRSATATVQLVIPPPPPLPAITAEGITNAASFRGSVAEGGVAPGELVTIFGTNLGPAAAQTLQLDARGFVATRLGGTRVLFDGTAGPMVVTSAGQVSAIVPYALEGARSVSVIVEFEGRQSPAVTVPVAPAAPAIFTQNSSGSGPASVIRQTGELITASAPAAAGEVLTLFATGEGATSPAGVDGKPADASLPRPKLPVKVLIDGVEIDPLYAGGAPGLVAGVLQVNFTMPAGAAGPRRLRLRVGDKLSPDSVTVAGR